MTSLLKAPFLSLVFALLCSAPLTAAAQKIAVVDMTRAINETEEGRQAREKLEKFAKARQTSLEKQKEGLMKMQADFKKQESVLTPEVKAKKEQEYNKALNELQMKLMEFQRELAAKEQQLTEDIVKRMSSIVRRIGQKDGYALVIDRQQAGVIFVPDAYDLTDVVIQRYNAGEGKEAVAEKQKKKK